MPTCGLCGKKFPNWVVINNKKRCLGKRKYCLKCSTFGKHNTRTLFSVEDLTGDWRYKICPKCKQKKKIDDFYKIKGRSGRGCTSKCKKCHNRYIGKRWIEKKKKAIAYLGGKCLDCGFDGHYAAFEFDHRDPKKKEFRWRKMKVISWERTKKELDKCDLRCANCHNIKHSLMPL